MLAASGRSALKLPSHLSPILETATDCVHRLLEHGPSPDRERGLTSSARAALARAYGCERAQAEDCLTALEEAWRLLLLHLAARHCGAMELGAERLRHGPDWARRGLPNLLDGTGTAPDASAAWAAAATKMRERVAGLPSLVGDDLAALHHALFPRSVRHDRGAYYTPAWLARTILAGLDPPESVLDPSCGAGAFLLAAVDRWWAGHPPDDWLPRLAGIELDPLAVLATKVSLLLRLPLGPLQQSLHLPIYQADAVLDPPPLDRRFGAVVGNPPWVFWNHLAPDYRDRLRTAMEAHGLIATGQGTMGRLGAACKDLSMLFVHVSAARYLAPGGELVFILPQTVLQSTAGHEFRRLLLPDGTPLAWVSVDDWTAVAAFVGAAVKPVVVRLQKGASTRWPVPYRRFVRLGEGDDGPRVRCEDCWARPSDPADEASFWSIDLVPEARTTSDNATRWPSRVGIDTKLEGLFRLQVTGRGARGVLVRNVTRNNKSPMPELAAEVEAALVYPIVTGRSLLSRWGAAPDGCYLVPHSPASGQRPLDEATMARDHPLALAYLSAFRERLEQRSIHRRWGHGQPYYAVYNIGPYSFAPWRVVWKASGSAFGATVISRFDHPVLGPRPLLAAKSVILLPFDAPEPAWFVCGLLNTTLARGRIAAGVQGWVHRQALNLVPSMPVYEPDHALHVAIAELARQAHELTAAGASCAQVEAELDDLAAQLWGRGRGG